MPIVAVSLGAIARSESSRRSVSPSLLIRAAKRVDDEETISDLVADALSFDLRSMPDSLGSRVMGRGSRSVRRWRHDRKKKKAARDKRKLAAVARPSQPR
jgi:hypothetical protein